MFHNPNRTDNLGGSAPTKRASAELPNVRQRAASSCSKPVAIKGTILTGDPRFDMTFREYSAHIKRAGGPKNEKGDPVDNLEETGNLDGKAFNENSLRKCDISQDSVGNDHAKEAKNTWQNVQGWDAEGIFEIELDLAGATPEA